MKGNNFLDSIGNYSRPEPNVEGDFDCFECRQRISSAYHDKSEGILIWWCDKEHQSSIKVNW
jgi:hypothetical protein